MFSSAYYTELVKNTGIINHLVNLVNNKDSLYGQICKLELVELETLKIYVKKKQAESFIKPFKSFANAQIPFVHKNYGSFCLFINY